MSIVTTLGYYRIAIFYYIIGGLTFIPLCAALLFGWFIFFAPVYHPEEKSPSRISSREESLGDVEFSEERKREALDLAVSNAEAQRQAEQEKGQDDGIGTSTAPPSAKRLMPPARIPTAKPHRAGWLVVRRQFQSEAALASQQATISQDGSTSSNTDANGLPSKEGEKGPGYMSSLYKGMLKYRNARGKEAAQQKVADSSAGSGTSTPESGVDDKGPLNAIDSSPLRNNAQKKATGTGGKESFYCILKGPVLYLYSSDDTSNSTTECHAAIDLRSKRVSLYISGVGDTIGEPDELEQDEKKRNKEAYDTESSTMSEAEEAKESAASSNWRKAKRAAVRDGELFTKRNAIRIVSMSSTSRSDKTRRYAQWFIFCRNATTLEDWYHALLHASLDQEDPIGPSFSAMDMVALLGSLDSLPDPIPLRWLNALVGRVFFSIYRTAWLEDYCTRKIMRKISRVKTPGFLSDIRVKEVDLGRSAPAFSRPMLKSLTGDGEASMEVAIHYTGAIRLTISTVLTISLGSRFKPYNVPLILAVIINSLEGNLLLQIKPPPSNRIWYAFTKLPKMDISVEPVVSERKVQWSMVKKLIEGRIRELLTESLVMPNMDDISFFDSRPLAYRGGIWSDASKRPEKSSAAEEEAEAAADEVSIEPKSKSTPASMVNVAMDEAEDKAETSALDSEILAKMKKRKPVIAIEDGEATGNSISLSTSPAAAGLSTLLARDMAREPTQNVQSDSSDGAAGSRNASANPNRRSWFTGRSNTISTGNDIASAAAASAKDSKSSARQQSSLAWGSASLSRPGMGDGADKRVIPEHNAVNEIIQDDGVRDRTTSVSSLGGESLTSIASADTEEFQTRLAAALEGQTNLDEETKTPLNHSDNVPTVTLQGSEDTEPGREALLDDTENAIPISLSPDQQSIIDEAGSDKSSLRSPIDAASSSVLPPPPRKSASHGFAPPPMRSATSRQASKEPSPTSSISADRGILSNSAAAAHLSALQRDRYGLSPRGTMSTSNQDDNASIKSNNLNTTSLLNTWNKAKASMADKNSRQIAAKEAKDALKRGWANWNAKRSGTLDATNQLDQLQTSSERDKARQSELAPSSRQDGLRASSWLASSPPDPASLGVGFDVTPSKEATMPTFDLDEDMARNREASRRTREESNSSTASSRASSVSGRAAYREHRASKERNQSKGSTDTSPLPPPSPAAFNNTATSIATPVPAATKNASSNSAASRDNSKSSLSASPSSIRKWSASATGNFDGQDSLGYSFAPSQGQATIGLTRPDLASVFDQTEKKPVSETPSLSTTAQPESILNPVELADTQREAAANEADVTITEAPALNIPKAESAEMTRKLSSSSTNSTVGPSHNNNFNSPSSPRLRSDSYLDSQPSPTTEGIKRQPMRATMMAIPGIPSNQKTGPQSFSAVPEPSKENSTKGETHSAIPASPRLGLGSFMSRIPSFGSSSATSASNVEKKSPLIGSEILAGDKAENASNPLAESNQREDMMENKSDEATENADTALQASKDHDTLQSQREAQSTSELTTIADDKV